jgi:hypothetical protein
MNIYEIMISFLNEVESKESNVTIAGGKGYSVGKAYPSKGVGVTRLLGKDSEIDMEEDLESLIAPVKISRIFTRRRKNGK